jgi:hypothetical protein
MNTKVLWPDGNTFVTNKSRNLSEEEQLPCLLEHFQMLDIMEVTNCQASFDTTKID